MRWTVPRSASALAAGLLGVRVATELAYTEAGGGRLTGPLINLCLFGGLVLLACAALLFTRRPAVTLTTIVAALLCLPLFAYRIAPSSVSWLSDAPPKFVPDHVLNFDLLAIGGAVAVLAVVAACVRALVGAD